MRHLKKLTTPLFSIMPKFHLYNIFRNINEKSDVKLIKILLLLESSF